MKRTNLHETRTIVPVGLALTCGLLILALVGGGVTMTRGQDVLAQPVIVPQFWDDFEQERTILDVLPVDFSRWTGYEFMPPGARNRIELTTDTASSGNHAMKFYAVPSTASSVAKADLEKIPLDLRRGQTIMFLGSFFIVGNDNIEGLFICDIEGPPDISRPGIRLMFTGGDDYLAVERGKFGLPPVVQPQDSAVRFPRNRWVKVKWYVKLSQGADGAIELWQDDQKIISQQGVVTMPSDVPPFLVGTDGAYTEWQVGITANTRKSDVLLYADDVGIALIQ